MFKSKVMALCLGLAAASAAFGQAGGGQGGGPGGGGGGRNFDPAQWRQRMEERMKEQLGVNDEEWKVLQPKVEKVQQLQMQSRGGGGFGGRGRGGPGGGGGPGGDANQPQSPVQQASADLRSVLDNKDSTPEQIKVKLDAYRAARTKAREELTAAQAELKDLLSARQEAALVSMGMLE